MANIDNLVQNSVIAIPPDVIISFVHAYAIIPDALNANILHVAILHKYNLCIIIFMYQYMFKYFVYLV